MFLSSMAQVAIILSSTVAAVNLTVASTGGNVSSPLQYGLMFEDINHSGDGGIYAELWVIRYKFDVSKVLRKQDSKSSIPRKLSIPFHNLPLGSCRWRCPFTGKFKHPIIHSIANIFERHGWYIIQWNGGYIEPRLVWNIGRAPNLHWIILRPRAIYWKIHSHFAKRSNEWNIRKCSNSGGKFKRRRMGAVQLYPRTGSERPEFE